MRIVVTLPSLAREFGGPVTKAQHLVQAFRDLGHEVSLVGSGEAEGAVGLGMLGRFHTTPIPRRLRPLARLVETSDVVHILGYRDPVGTVAAFLAHRQGVPFFLEPAGMYALRIRSFRIKRAFEVLLGGRLLERCSGVIATSRIEAEEFKSSLISSDRVFVRPNGVTLGPTNETLGTWRQTFGIPSDVKLVVALGRITVKKTLSDLVRAAELLEDVWVLIVGPPERDGALEELQRTVRSSPARARVIVHPAGIWEADKFSLLKEADCFCLPSLYENFGNAVAEAAACGLPVVVSDQCGVAEFLPSALAEVVPFGDLERLSEALDRALSIRQDVLKAGAEQTLSDLSWERVARLQVDLYMRAGATLPSAR